jgi:hypothetical protein
MRLAAPVTAGVAGALHGFAARADSHAGRWYCGLKEYQTWVAAGELVVGAGVWYATEINPDIPFGAMIGGATLLGNRTGLFLGRPKNVCPGGGCHSAGKSGCYGGSTPWAQGYWTSIANHPEALTPEGTLAYRDSPGGETDRQEFSPGGALAYRDSPGGESDVQEFSPGGTLSYMDSPGGETNRQEMSPGGVLAYHQRRRYSPSGALV